VRIQIWTAISAYLLVAIMKKTLDLKPSLHEILQVVSVTPFEKVTINELFMKDMTVFDSEAAPEHDFKLLASNNLLPDTREILPRVQWSWPVNLPAVVDPDQKRRNVRIRHGRFSRRQLRALTGTEYVCGGNGSGNARRRHAATKDGTRQALSVYCEAFRLGSFRRV